MLTKAISHLSKFGLILVRSALSLAIIYSSGSNSFAATAAKQIEGSARIVDGDTIEVHRLHIRLLGMDAPEKAQICRDERNQEYRCGISAATALDKIIARDAVSCQSTATDRYGRQLAICRTANFADIGLEMIRRGWATIYDGAPASAEYKSAEDIAKGRHIGLWAGSFERPSSWRRSKRAQKQ